jgi:hypothetical protein
MREEVKPMEIIGHAFDSQRLSPFEIVVTAEPVQQVVTCTQSIDISSSILIAEDTA